MAARLDKQALAEVAIREVVAVGMDTPFREPILEGVEKGTGAPVTESRRLPVAVGLLATSFVTGYFLGRRSTQE
ncbi:hypothetical protein CV102_01125 [Natronococcus pandeyae]|uniref:Uncharacterized protein n=1 Tax=Natronococcus pandeyae TaxID=2055836 RepID=A0A8J8Q956_9EURY|nr:hypothetical protein [Natronococcus pandeyae]TYL40214.1 hypothetical protein CV102_01125 [Natronococcus pandeyae]